MSWQRVESELDRKLLLRFDPYQMQVEVVTRRYSPSTGRLRIVERANLLTVMPADLAGTIAAVIRDYLHHQHLGGSAIAHPAAPQ